MPLEHLHHWSPCRSLPQLRTLHTYFYIQYEILQLKTVLWKSVLKEHTTFWRQSSLPVTLALWTKVHLEQTIVTQLLKKIHPQKFMTITTKARQWFLSWVTLIQSTASHPKSHFNIILSSTARPLKWSHPFGVSYQKICEHFSTFPTHLNKS
jgi:hypothetical protein